MRIIIIHPLHETSPGLIYFRKRTILLQWNFFRIDPLDLEKVRKPVTNIAEVRVNGLIVVFMVGFLVDGTRESRGLYGGGSIIRAGR